MATIFNHIYSELSTEAQRNRLKAVNRLYLAACKDIENVHIHISTRNRKTGVLVPSISLIPVKDCPGCKLCAHGCYDLRHNLIHTSLQKCIAENSALLHTDIDRFFAELHAAITKQLYKFFRYNVGGDITSRAHFDRIIWLAEALPETEFLIFTKSYNIVNEFLAEGRSIPENLHLILSDWRGAKFDNIYNLPISSPVWRDKKTGQEIERGPHATGETFCPGDCSACAENCAGCWSLKNGETILFEAH